MGKKTLGHCLGVIIFFGIAFSIVLIDNVIPSRYNHTTDEGYQIEISVYDFQRMEDESYYKSNCKFYLEEEANDYAIINIDFIDECSYYLKINFYPNNTYEILFFSADPNSDVLGGKFPFWRESAEYSEVIEFDINDDWCYIEGKITVKKE